MISTPARRTAAVMLGLTGILHLILAPEYLGKTAYIGLLFLGGGIVASVSAVRLWSVDDRLAWRAGILTASGMAVGLLLSRTTGLPAFKESEWELSAIVTMLAEAGFLGVAARTALRLGRPATAPRSA